MKWKLRVLDAVITTNVLCGMETFPTAQPDYDKIYAFQIRIVRIILNTKHPYWSRVSNNTVSETVNTRAQNTNDNENITPLSTNLKQRLVKFFGHIIRSDPSDRIREICVDENGDRIRAQFRRRGRPELKWYDTAKTLVTKSRVKLNSSPITWKTDFNQQEVSQYIIQAANDRNY